MECIEIGKGIHGIVREKVLPDGRCVAVKTITCDYMEGYIQDGVYDSFLRELLALNKLKLVDGVVQIESFSLRRIKGETLCEITMERLDCNLSTYCENICITNRRIVYPHLLEQMKMALSTIHDMNIIHRDVKLENILVDTQNGLFKLCDFGSSCFMNNKDKWIKCEEVVYPRDCRPPEVEMMKQYNTTADVWSLCITLIVFLSGGRINNPPEEVKSIPSLNLKYKGRLCYKHIGTRIDIRRYVRDHLWEEDIRMLEESLHDMSTVDPRERLSLKRDIEIVDDSEFNDVNLRKEYEYIASKVGYSKRTVDESLRLYQRLKVDSDNAAITCFILVSKIIEIEVKHTKDILSLWGHNSSYLDIVRMEIELIKKVKGIIID